VQALDPPSVNFWTKVFGLLLTVLALSLGAPFWFDMLNKIINIRSSGPPPVKSDGSGNGKPKVTTIVR
jgi:hypothetical protein